MYRNRHRWWIIPATLTTLLLSACGDEGGTQSAPPQSPQVVVSAPLKKTITEWDEYTGRFEAVDLVEVRSRVSGYLDSIHFKDGQIVQKGDLLFVIDPRPFVASLDASKAQLASARASLELANVQLVRAKELRRTQAVSEAVLDQRETDVRAAQAQVLQAEAQIRRSELDVEFTRISAPVTGRVSEHFVSVGNLVSGGAADSTLLTRIVSLDPIHFYFDADQNAYLSYVRLSREGARPSSRDVANPVRLALDDESEFSHEGKMDFVDNRIDFSTGTIRGRAIFSNPDLLFTPGLFARMRLIGRGNYDALLLPDSAIGTDQSRRFVYVVKPDGSLDNRTVQIGPIYEGLRVVRGGLKPEEKVVVAGVQRIRPGTTVTPVDQPIRDPAASPGSVPAPDPAPSAVKVANPVGAGDTP